MRIFGFIVWKGQRGYPDDYTRQLNNIYCFISQVEYANVFLGALLGFASYMEPFEHPMSNPSLLLELRCTWRNHYLSGNEMKYGL